MADLKPGDLVGWKMRAALILGHVDRVEGDKVVLIPESKPSARVSRHREKVLLRSELDPADIATAEAHGGHMARRETHPRSAKAKAMGLASPTQLMPEPLALATKKKRNAAYAQDLAAMHEHDAAAAAAGGGKGGKGGGGRKRKATAASGGSSSSAAAAAAPPKKKQR